MKKKIAAGLLAVGFLFTGSQAANAGGSTYDFYYGPKVSPTVWGFYGIATNYDSSNHSKQTYHWAFKSIPTGYKAFEVKICAQSYLVSGRTEGYSEWQNRTVDCAVSFRVVRLSTNTVSPAAIIPGASWH